MRESRAVKNIVWVLAAIGVGTLCVFFPRFLAFLELALREVRYLWWLILILFIGLYLYFGSKKSD